jgi:hypothetical protein
MMMTTNSGIARHLCLLSQSQTEAQSKAKSACGARQPLGLIAWEVPFPAHLMPLAAGQIPRSGSGRNLHVAAREDMRGPDAPRGVRPLPTVPLLVRMTSRSMRVLYLCAPEEALAVGQRLALQARAALGAESVSECAPAVLVDMMQKYRRADCHTQALLDPETTTGQIVSWVPPVPPVRLLRPEDQAVHVHCWYLGRPTVLAPVGLLSDPPGLPEDKVAEALSSGALQQQLFSDSYFASLPVRVTKEMINALVPLRADRWAQELLRIRQDVSALLGSDLGYFILLQEDFVEMVAALYGELPTLRGAEQVRLPQVPSRRASSAMVREFYERLMRAVGFRFKQRRSGPRVVRPVELDQPDPR